MLIASAEFEAASTFQRLDNIGNLAGNCSAIFVNGDTLPFRLIPH